MNRVWIGDWLRTWRKLGPAAASDGNVRLAELLGIREMLASPGVGSTGTAPPAASSGGNGTGNEPDDSRSSEDAAGSGDRAPAEPADTEIRIRSLPRRSSPATPPALAPLLPPPAARLPVREIEPLFRRATTRALLSAAAATWRLEGPIVVKELVDQVARWTPVRRLPRHPVPTVRVGAVLLISHSVTEPFAADVIDLRRQLRRIAGTGSVAEAWLEDDLQLRRRSRHPLRWPPAPGTPVLALTSMIEGLDTLAGDLSRLGCPLIAIAPGRGEVARVRNLTVIAWDHRTRVASVMRARRRADRR